VFFSLIKNLTSLDAPFEGKKCKISDPHSNAVIDFDGDCLAGSKISRSLFAFKLTTRTDVFLTCEDDQGRKTYQIWVNGKEKGFILSQEGTLPSGTLAISFADIGSPS